MIVERLGEAHARGRASLRQSVEVGHGRDGDHLGKAAGTTIAVSRCAFPADATRDAFAGQLADGLVYSGLRLRTRGESCFVGVSTPTNSDRLMLATSILWACSITQSRPHDDAESMMMPSGRATRSAHNLAPGARPTMPILLSFAAANPATNVPWPSRSSQLVPLPTQLWPPATLRSG